MFTPPIGTHVEELEARHLLTFTPLGAEVDVPFPTEMSQFDMAVAGDGSFIVVADPIEQPGSPDLVAVRYDANGQQIGAPLTLDDRGFNVDVSMDADGDAVVAYQKGLSGVYVVRISKAGVVSAPQLVGTLAAGHTVTECAVAMDDGGGFFVTWIGHQRDPQPRPVRAFDAAGQPRAPEFTVPGGSGSHPQHSIGIAASPDGSEAILTSVGVNSTADVNYVDRVSTRAWLGDRIFDVGNIAPEPVTYSDGSFLVGSTSGPREFFQFRDGVVTRYDANGEQVGAFIRIDDSFPFALIRSVTVDALPDGGFLAGYVRETAGVVTTYVERYSAGNVSITGPVPLDVSPAKLHRVGVGTGGSGVMAYLELPRIEDQYENLSGEVRFRRLTVAGSRLEGGELFVNGADGNDHIIVERVRERLWVNVNGIVDGFNAADVQFLSISGLGGDDDIVNASAIPSTISGGDGADTLWGGTGSDDLRGFGGNDVLRSGDGDDVLLGDSGNDTLDGGDGTDTLTGGQGADLPLFGEVHDGLHRGFTLAGNVLVFAGSEAAEGIGIGPATPDGVTLEIWQAHVTHRLPLGAVERIEMYGNGGDDIFNVHHLLGIPVTLDGGAGNDELRGGRMSDVLRGGDGDDWLYSNRGGDMLDGGFGADHMQGDDGFDTIDYSSRVNGLFIDLTTFRGDGEPGENDYVIAERIIGGSGNDHIRSVSGDPALAGFADEAIFGGPGNDLLVGFGGSDSLFGEAGNDTLDGGDADDYLEGGAGHDELTGGSGADALFGLAGNDRLFAAGDGFADTVRGGADLDWADADDSDDVLGVKATA